MDGRLELLKKVIEVAHSSIGFEVLVRREGLDRALLLTVTPEPGTLAVKKASPREAAWEGMTVKAVRTPLGEALDSRRPVFLPRLTRRDHKTLMKHPIFKGATSLLTLPVEDDNRVYGVLCLLQQKPMAPEEGGWEGLILVAREIAGVIRNAEFYTESKKRIAELSVLHQVGRVIGSTLELPDLIRRTVAITAQVINARGSALMILDQHSEQILIESEFGTVPPQVKKRLLQDLLALKGDLLHREKEPTSVQSPSNRSRGRKAVESEKTEPFASFMCVPLHFKGAYRGRLCVYDKISTSGEGSVFTEEELAVLSTIGSIIANALENALTFQQVENLARKNEWMVRNLSTLYQIDSAMMTTASLQDLPQIILEAITLKQGLGFNRAILFLADEAQKALIPMAWSIQRRTAAETSPPATADMKNETLSGYFVRQAAEIRRARQEADQAIQDIKIPLTKEAGILARTFLEGRTFLVKRVAEDPRTNQELARRLNLDSFAAVPILAKDKVIGVIEVDNFIDKRPFTQEDLNLLSMLAHQAGLALENARLYATIEKTNAELKTARERLIESEKMMAIGEMASGLAHEIRNPLVSIGGFVRRLQRKYPDDDLLQSYVQVIINEVERLEKILNEITAFTQDPRGHYQEWAFNPILEGALHLIARELKDHNITVQTEWGNVPKVFGDSRQLIHAFYNLFFNALQAMPEGGLLSVRTFVKKEAGKTWVAGEVADTGGGIPPELLHNIFNPFFTTKVHGSGLGLPIVHKIITRHYGEVDIDNRPGEGVSFVVKLHSAKEVLRHLQNHQPRGEKKHEKNLDRR